MTWHLHTCAATDCHASILLTARTEYPLPFGARATVLHAEGWMLSLVMWPALYERALCPLHRALYEAGEAPLCSRCAGPWCRCYRGPLPALGTAVRVQGRRVVKTYGAATPAAGE